MGGQRTLEWSRKVDTGKGTFHLYLYREDFSAVFPFMCRYTLLLIFENEILGIFRTNSYEYSPTVPLDAESSACKVAEEWERDLQDDPISFLASLQERHPLPFGISPSDVLVIQGSPRSDGNCSILAGWVCDAATEAGKTVQVLFPDDMAIHPCIGCYRCFNTGTCTFEDDMTAIIGAIQHSSLLAVCSPVYTNTVPGMLKILIDRCQAYQASMALIGGIRGPEGLILGVCGRVGQENFGCLTPVLDVFMKNVGIRPSDHILVNGVDEVRDISTIPGLKTRVKKSVIRLLEKK